MHHSKCYKSAVTYAHIHMRWSYQEQSIHSHMHSHTSMAQDREQFGFSILLKDTLTHRVQGLGIEPLTMLPPEPPLPTAFVGTLHLVIFFQCEYKLRLKTQTLCGHVSPKHGICPKLLSSQGL